jgi:hypothetical protein
MGRPNRRAVANTGGPSRWHIYDIVEPGLEIPSVRLGRQDYSAVGNRNWEKLTDAIGRTPQLRLQSGIFAKGQHDCLWVLR